MLALRDTAAPFIKYELELEQLVIVLRFRCLTFSFNELGLRGGFQPEPYPHKKSMTVGNYFFRRRRPWRTVPTVLQ